MEFLRVLAISPSTRSFGFAVLEEPNQLIDWGMKTTRIDKNARCVSLVSELLDHYKPDVFILEDCWVKSSRRRPRIKALIKDLSILAAAKRVRTRTIPRDIIRKAFSPTGALTKQQVAMTIVSQFPELALHLPPARKPWMSEDCRMAIFDAVAFALTFFYTIERS
jgi:Holliday junction resolvasome RuvABC endonuclease subunit